MFNKKFFIMQFGFFGVLLMVFLLVVVIFTSILSIAGYLVMTNEDIQYVEPVDSSNGGRGAYGLPILDDGERFYYPVEKARISDLYRYRKYHPVHGGSVWHRGIDLDTPNTEIIYVYPARPGEVVKVVKYSTENLPKYINDKGREYTSGGQSVTIKHNIKGQDVYTVYMHLYRVLVDEGQFVNMTTPIGIAGNTGDSTGAHLHFEIRKTISGDHVDPAKFLYCGGISKSLGDDVSECFKFRQD